MQLRVLQHRAGVIAECEQNLVVVLLESAGLVARDHCAAEPVTDVDRDRDEILDLRIVGVVVADRPVARDHLAREALHDRNVLRIALEVLRDHEVEVAVAVEVLARHEDALLRPEQLESDLEDHRARIRRVAERAVGVLQLDDLPAQLGVPVVDGFVGLVLAHERLLLLVQLGAQIGLELLQLVGRSAFDRPHVARGTHPPDERCNPAGGADRRHDRDRRWPQRIRDEQGKAHTSHARADLGGRPDRAGEARHDVEEVLARAKRDVVLEPGRAVGTRVQAGGGIGEGRCHELRGERRVRRLAAEEPDDPPCAVRVVQSERSLEPRADDRDVTGM